MAKAAGVSPGAVSFALNGRPGVSEDTRRRVIEAADRLGWRPDARARALGGRRSASVGLVLARDPHLLGADPFFARFIAGVETELAARDMSLLLQVVPEAGERRAYERLAGARLVGGVFLLDVRVDDDRPRLLREFGLPAVVVGRRTAGEDCVVTVDDRPGIRALVTHLAGLGHRRIAHVSGPLHYVHGADRQRAWADALAEHGLPPGPCVDADFSPGGGVAATRRLLALPLDERPTAIVYGNDLMAVAGLGVLREAGVDVPGGMSVTGFDDVELGAWVTPALTTVRADVLAWGAAAARALLALVDGQAPASADLPPAEVVLRASTAAPP